MFHKINESKFFVDLSNEQQQLIAGGGQLIGVDQIAKTFLDLKQKKSDTTVMKEVSSDLSGSRVKFGVMNTYEEDDYSTGGIENVWLKFL